MANHTELNFDELDEEYRVTIAKIEAERQAAQDRQAAQAKLRDAFDALLECTGSEPGGDTIVVYAAEMNDDTPEGKKGTRTEGYFLSRKDAENAAFALQSEYGDENRVPVTAITVHLDLASWIHPESAISMSGRLDSERAGLIRNEIDFRAGR